MIVKVCGLMNRTDGVYANMASPDMVGIVFWKNSRRCLDKDGALSVKELLGNIPVVGVFVDNDVSEIRDLVDSGVIDIVQIHGNADDSYVKRVRDETGVPMIRGYVVKTKEDVDRASTCEAEYTLLDAGFGQGRTIDWSLLEDVGFPYILSGGLTPQNVLEAVRRLHPMGVDASSGLETNGAKDPTKMTSFVYAARGDFEPIIEHKDAF